VPTLKLRARWLLVAFLAFLPAVATIAAEGGAPAAAPVSREQLANRFGEHCRTTLQSQRELVSGVASLAKGDRKATAKADLALANLDIQERTCLCFTDRVRSVDDARGEQARLRGDHDGFMAEMKPEFQACAGASVRPRLEAICMLVYAAGEPNSQGREQARASCRSAATEVGAMSDLELGTRLGEAVELFERKLRGEQAPPQS